MCSKAFIMLTWKVLWHKRCVGKTFKYHCLVWELERWFNGWDRRLLFQRKISRVWYPEPTCLLTTSVTPPPRYLMPLLALFECCMHGMYRHEGKNTHTQKLKEKWKKFLCVLLWFSLYIYIYKPCKLKLAIKCDRGLNVIPIHLEKQLNDLTSYFSVWHMLYMNVL